MPDFLPRFESLEERRVLTLGLFGLSIQSAIQLEVDQAIKPEVEVQVSLEAPRLEAPQLEVSIETQLEPLITPEALSVLLEVEASSPLTPQATAQIEVNSLSEVDAEVDLEVSSPISVPLKVEVDLEVEVNPPVPVDVDPPNPDPVGDVDLDIIVEIEVTPPTPDPVDEVDPPIPLPVDVDPPIPDPVVDLEVDVEIEVNPPVEVEPPIPDPDVDVEIDLDVEVGTGNEGGNGGGGNPGGGGSGGGGGSEGGENPLPTEETESPASTETGPVFSEFANLFVSADASDSSSSVLSMLRGSFLLLSSAEGEDSATNADSEKQPTEESQTERSNEEQLILDAIFGAGDLEKKSSKDADVIVVNGEVVTVYFQNEGVGQSPSSSRVSAGPLSSDAAKTPAPVGSFDQAIDAFLSELGMLAQNLTNWLMTAGPWPWILMGLAGAITLQQAIRRQRHKRDADAKAPRWLSQWVPV